MAIIGPAKIETWEPKPKPPPILTNEEQRAIDKAALDSDKAQGKVFFTPIGWNTVPKDQWPEVTPIQPIPHRRQIECAINVSF